MIGWGGQWTWIPSATPLQPKKWNANFWIMFNVWWSAGLVNGLESHPPPLSSQKNEMLVFVLWSTSDDRPGLLMNLNPICHPSPAKKMKCSFFDYVQLLMIGRAGQWTRTPSAIPLQTKKWYAHFCITFKFWSLAGLVDGLKPHPPPFSNQNNEMLIFGLCWASDSWLGWSMDSNPIHHLSPGKKWNAHFEITFYFWWLARLVNGLKPHLQPLSNQKNEMLIFVLCSNSGDQPGWSIDSNPICHPCPTKKWNACFCITLYFWWSAGLVNKLEPHPLPFSSQKNEMLIFVLHSTSDDWPGWSMDSNPIHLLPQAKKNEMLIFVLHSTSDEWPGC